MTLDGARTVVVLAAVALLGACSSSRSATPTPAPTPTHAAAESATVCSDLVKLHHEDNAAAQPTDSALLWSTYLRTRVPRIHDGELRTLARDYALNSQTVVRTDDPRAQKLDAETQFLVRAFCPDEDHALFDPVATK